MGEGFNRDPDGMPITEVEPRNPWADYEPKWVHGLTLTDLLTPAVYSRGGMIPKLDPGVIGRFPRGGVRAPMIPMRYSWADDSAPEWVKAPPPIRKVVPSVPIWPPPGEVWLVDHSGRLVLGRIVNLEKAGG